jgi:pimeloyl-ACP methyl ester carboxylesterase
VIVSSGSLAPGGLSDRHVGFYTRINARSSDPPSRASVRAEVDAQSWSTRHVTGDFVDRLLEIAELPKQGRVAISATDPRFVAELGSARDGALHAIDAGALPTRTMLVWGRDDPSAAYELGLALFARVAAKTEDATFHLLSRAGHYCFRERPATFNRLLVQHLLAEPAGQARDPN